jgi:hypothetical protein
MPYTDTFSWGWRHWSLYSLSQAMKARISSFAHIQAGKRSLKGRNTSSSVSAVSFMTYCKW